VDSPLVIHDEVYNRNIHIEHTGSATAVVWNPWVELSRQSKDLENDSYQHFICVETANAADDIITVAADETCTLGVEYHIQ
jgi:glucose-6-phosphate 1-epimerase